MQTAGEAARERVLSNVEPELVCQLEQLAVMHSIRRILMWVLVIGPAIAVGLVFVLNLPGIGR
jgi:hypothetical protein